ncbi:MAG TPA: UDP-N-acetylmuramate:L-alanyl-gamma-D-glutamyl-meso-diaminopimelate ligase, partial [Methylophilaceae bacterium]|nr:UDP-N-acetylmuramate:L-alanyl-gamma-D-glutamyl-meso-diaminopimelate ligase [Methylophilaceae bacterium]
DQTSLNPDIYVIGNVVTRGNPLMEAILDRGLPYISGPQWLAENVLQGKWVLAVAGTHGKTTTASMLAWILEYAGLAPGFLIGGVPQNFGISARLPGISPKDSNYHLYKQQDLAVDTRRPAHSGRDSTDGYGEAVSTAQQSDAGKDAVCSPFFVIEADEYDTAFFDKRSKFVHYHPRTAILNNLEFDHADIFADLAAIETQFHHLVRTVPGQGLVVANGREESLQRVLQRGCWTPVETFGDSGGWQAGEVHQDGSFDVLHAGKFQGRVQWELLGEHNRMNALATLAAARHVGVPVEVGIAALSTFQNVKRRMEVRGVVNAVTVYDDFAHHPTAIATTVAGLRAKVGHARILAVLEPRSNTMKLGVMKAALPDSLVDADQVFCYGANLGWDAAEAFAPIAHKAKVYDDMPAMVEAIVASARPGDHVLVMSNGGFGGVHQKLLERLGT